MDLEERWKLFEEVYADKEFQAAEEIHCVSGVEGKFFFGLRSGKVLVKDIEENQEATLQAHNGAVSCILVHPQMEFFITSGQDKTIAFWNFQSLEKVQVLNAHKEVVTSLAVHEKKLFSASVDEKVIVWDLDSFSYVQELEVGSPVSSLHVNTEHLFVGTDEGTIKVFALSDLSEECLLTGHQDAVWSIDSLGQVVVSGSYDSGIRIWDVKTQESALLGEHEGVVSKVLICDPSGAGMPIILSGGSDNLIRVWSLTELKDIWECHEAAISSLLATPTYLVSVGFDKKIRCWNWLSQLKTKTVLFSTQTIYAACETNNTLFFAKEDGLVVKSQEQENKIEMFEGRITSLSVDSGTLIVGCKDQAVYLLDSQTLDLKEKFTTHSQSALSVSIKGNLVLSGGQDCTLVLYSLENSTTHSKIELESSITSTSISERFVCCATSEKLYVLSPDLEVVNQVELSGVMAQTQLEGEYLIYSKDNYLNCMHLPECEHLAKFPVMKPILSIYTHPDLPYFVCSTKNRILRYPHILRELSAILALYTSA